jgi:hypothetical protein
MQVLTLQLSRTLIQQSHLFPMPQLAATVHWGFDYTLSLYPQPDLVWTFRTF